MKGPQEYHDELLAKALELRTACENVLKEPTLFYLLTRDEARSVALALSAGRFLHDRVKFREPIDHIYPDATDPDWIKEVRR